MFERLTLWDDANKCWVEDHSRDTREWKNGHNACMNRLATYEDSGLTPEQVQELAKAKADGRLVVFPCKTGDTVYVVSGCLFYHDETPYTPCEVVVFKQVKQRGVMMHLRPLCEEAAGTRYHRWFPLKSIGKTVFLTREEAEKALEGLETRKQRGY